MHWLPIALFCAFSLSTADALSKRALDDTQDIVIAWVRQGYALPFLALAFLFVPVPALDQTFWAAVAALVPLEIIAILLYVRAIRLSPFSLSVPFLALTPVFVILVAFVILGEVPSLLGGAGVVLIAAGAYILNVRASKEGLLGPIRAIKREPGSVLMIAVAVIYSITSTLGKLAVEHSSPVFFGFFYPFILTVVLTGFIFAKGRHKEVFSRPGRFFPIGFFTALMVLSHYIAISLTNVSYMIAVKRMSIVFSVVYGKVLFRELNIKERLLGSAVMAGGAALIVLS